MAYRPSRRQTRRAPEALEPNMAPIMNLMVVLIPLLLTSVQLIKIGVIELNLPPASSETQHTDAAQETDKGTRLDLAVTITNKGFYVSGPTGVITQRQSKIMIPKKDGQFDYEQLALQLLDIKQRIADQYNDGNAITIQAEAHIDYQTLVSTMDAARVIRVDGQDVLLFPKASVSAGLL